MIYFFLCFFSFSAIIGMHNPPSADNIFNSLVGLQTDLIGVITNKQPSEYKIIYLTCFRRTLRKHKQGLQQLDAGTAPDKWAILNELHSRISDLLNDAESKIVENVKLDPIEEKSVTILRNLKLKK
jgi:hypothetical protein